MIPGDSWHAPQVIDENYGETGERAEVEPSPYGGIPGIFSELAQEMRLNYEVQIEAISNTSLQKNYGAAADVIAQVGWQAVVLQEITDKPLPESLTMSSLSDPAGFRASVQTVEQAVHAVAPAASIFLYETWPNGALAHQIAGDETQPGFHEKFVNALNDIGDTNLASYQCAEQQDGKVAGIAPVGEAWRLAWAEGLANPDPFQSSPLPSLWYGINAVNDPPLSKAHYVHPSTYGAYLSGLVLFVQMTGAGVRSLGASEQAAARLTVKKLRDTTGVKRKNPCTLLQDTQ